MPTPHDISRHDIPRRLRTPGAVLPAVLLALLAAGCGRPLAVQHEFFSPMSGNADRIGAQVSHAVSHHRAAHAVHRECAPPPSGPVAWRATDPAGDGPNPGSTTADAALANLCDTPARPPVAAHGATSNAYQRWVDDNVRALPSPSETAAGAGGS